MGKWLVGLLGIVVLAAGGLALLPLRLVVPQVAPELTATAISGSIWDGRLAAAQWRGVPLGDLAVGLDPGELRAGRVRLDFVHHVEGLDGPLELALPFAFAPRLALALDDAALTLAPGGSCRTAGGRVAARVSGIPGIGTTPPLAGTLACDDGALFMPLASADGQLGIAVHLWVDRRYRADLIVATRSLAVRLALAAAGFSSGPDGATLRIEGQF
jgi:general secretion pathway protein N